MSDFLNIKIANIPMHNPKKYVCYTNDLIKKNDKFYIKNIRFICDNCNSPMIVKNGMYGLFISCPNWKKDKNCAKNTISLIIKKR